MCDLTFLCYGLVRFNGFYDEDSTQETLYHNSACPLIPCVLQGYNASVFAYGPTGAGKEIFQLGVFKTPNGKIL